MSKMRFFALQELANRRPVKVDYPSEKLADYYGNHVFDRKKMQEYLPSEAYKAVINAIEKGTPINREMADMIANGMKNWAKTFNVTHYTHWFQPLNRMHPVFPTAVSGTHLKHVAIRHGMFLLRLSL